MGVEPKLIEIVGAQLVTIIILLIAFSKYITKLQTSVKSRSALDNGKVDEIKGLIRGMSDSINDQRRNTASDLSDLRERVNSWDRLLDELERSRAYRERALSDQVADLARRFDDMRRLVPGSNPHPNAG